VKTYGAASAEKPGLVTGLGATPVDYRLGPIDRLVRACEPAGVDFVFDAIGGANIGRCLRAISPRGRKSAPLNCWRPAPWKERSF